jgi:RES domain-containing protein
MRRQLALAVAAAPRAAIEGRYERHFSFGRRELTGSDSGGRWGPPGGYSVLYLGRPVASVTVEAYRHLVDPFVDQGMTGGMVAPRRLLVCEVAVTNVLDLRSRTAQVAVGLTEADLTSPVGEYEPCQEVGRVAHQLGLHGVLAPAATGLGETLALFEQHLPASELPTLLEEEIWDGLPEDPRRLRLVSDEEAPRS